MKDLARATTCCSTGSAQFVGGPTIEQAADLSFTILSVALVVKTLRAAATGCVCVRDVIEQCMIAFLNTENCRRERSYKPRKMQTGGSMSNYSPVSSIERHCPTINVTFPRSFSKTE